MDTQELEAGHMIHLDPINVLDGYVSVAASCPLVVQNKLFGLLGVECKIVAFTSSCQVLILFHVGHGQKRVITAACFCTGAMIAVLKQVGTPAKDKMKMSVKTTGTQACPKP